MKKWNVFSCYLISHVSTNLQMVMYVSSCTHLSHCAWHAEQASTALCVHQDYAPFCVGACGLMSTLFTIFIMVKRGNMQYHATICLVALCYYVRQGQRIEVLVELCKRLEAHKGVHAGFHRVFLCRNYGVLYLENTCRNMEKNR